jgi:hypothetical protein
MNHKKLNIRLISIMMMSVILLTGCQKVHDYIHLPPNGDAVYKFCSIREVTAVFPTELNDYIVHYIFTYNKQGNPLQVINDYIATGNPNLLFKYDKYNRLVQFVRPYTNGSYETMDKYGYNSKNQIVRDTLYAFGDFLDSVALPAEQPNRYTSYEYDVQNRIIGQTDSIFSPGNILAAVTHESYSYDDKGDLISPGVVYDNKLNIRRTNKVWMFITKDYSVNNPFIATEYNEHGLPIAFSSAYTALNIIVPLSGNGLVEYSCK